MQIAIYSICVCLELNNLKSLLKCRRAVRRHPRVIIAGVLLSVRDSRTVSGQSRTHGTQSTNIAGAAPARKFLRQRRS